MKIRFVVIRSFFSLLSVLSARFAGKLAFELFQHPHAKKTRSRELDIFREFNEKRIKYNKEDLYVYEKGNKNDHPVIMVHGWESNPGSMYGIARRLTEHHFRVIVLGLPAHGKSGLRKTTMIDAADCIIHLLESYKIRSGFSMITHSFGSGAASFALKKSGFRADSLVFLTSPDRIRDIFDNFARMIRLGKKAHKELIRITESKMNLSIESFNISDFLMEANYKSLLLIQDQEDKVLPWENALQIKNANPNIKLLALKNKGHYRILWDREVIDTIISELKH